MSLLFRTQPAALDERVRCAEAVSQGLIADVLAAGQLPSWQPTRSKRLGQLVRAGAWTDVALELIELELPQWKLRRLAYEDGEWCCALSRQRELPDWLDQAVEGRHADLVLAILSALIEGLHLTDHAGATETPPAPAGGSTLFEAILSDNFA